MDLCFWTDLVNVTQGGCTLPFPITATVDYNHSFSRGYHVVLCIFPAPPGYKIEDGDCVELPSEIEVSDEGGLDVGQITITRVKLIKIGGVCEGHYMTPCGASYISQFGGSPWGWQPAIGGSGETKYLNNTRMVLSRSPANWELRFAGGYVIPIGDDLYYAGMLSDANLLQVSAETAFGPVEGFLVNDHCY